MGKLDSGPNASSTSPPRVSLPLRAGLRQGNVGKGTVGVSPTPPGSRPLTPTLHRISSPGGASHARTRGKNTPSRSLARCRSSDTNVAAQPPEPVVSPSQSTRDLLPGEKKSTGAAAKQGTQNSRKMSCDRRSTAMAGTRAGTGTPGQPRASSRPLHTSVAGASLRTDLKASSTAAARAGGLKAAATAAAAVKSTPSHCATNTARGAASVQHSLNRSHRGRQSQVSVGNRRPPRQSPDEGGRQHSLIAAKQVTDRLKPDGHANDEAADVTPAGDESGKDTATMAASSSDSQNDVATTASSDSQTVIDVKPPAPKAVRITGCPEAYKRFEEGVFVHYKDVNGKPSFACGFKNYEEEAQHYALWWAPDRKVFMMGPLSSSGTMAGFFYVPGDGVDDPTKATMQWVAFDNQSGGWAAFATMRCVEVNL